MECMSNVFSSDTLARGLSMVRQASLSMMDDPELAAMQAELKAGLRFLNSEASSCCFFHGRLSSRRLTSLRLAWKMLRGRK